jgi:hypothetical protein
MTYSMYIHFYIEKLLFTTYITSFMENSYSQTEFVNRFSDILLV